MADPFHGISDEAYRSIFEIIEQCKKKELIIYGAGFWGIQAYKIFARLKITPKLLVDDDSDKQGKYFNENGVTTSHSGVSIVSLDEAISLYPNAIYVCAVTQDNNNNLKNMNEKLKEKGLFSKYSHFLPMKYMVLLYGGLDGLSRSTEIGQNNFSTDNVNNIIIFNHMTSSGALYFNTLVDNHPNILTIVNIYNAALVKAYNLRLKYLEDEELAIEISAQMFRYFKWDLPIDMFAEHCYCRITERYFSNEKGKPEEHAYIDGADFLSWLLTALKGRGKVSFGYLLKAIITAYYNTIGKIYDPNQTYWLFYDNHQQNFNTETIHPLIQYDFNKIEYWTIIREPVQHIFSFIMWLDNLNNRYPMIPLGHLSSPANVIDVLSCDLGIMLQKNEINNDKVIRVIRFEDVKRGEEYMRVICDVLDIPYNDCLLETTFNGIQIYFPTSDNSGKSIVITGNDKTAVKRKDFSQLLTSFDIFRINLAVQDFKRQYGYEVDIPHHSEFTEEFIEELYRIPFKFENKLIEIAQRYIKEGHFSDGTPQYHKCVTDLFLDYIKNGKQEMYDTLV